MNPEDVKKPFVLEVPVFADDRGIFSPFLDAGRHADLFLATGGVKRVYYVYNHAAGVVRGFHYHKKEWKIFNVVKGAMKFVAINPEDPKEMYTFVSSDRKNQLVVIPPLYANGLVSLEPGTILVCASNLTTEESFKADDKRFDPYMWGDVWGVKGR